MSQRVRMAKPRGYRAAQAVRFVSGRNIKGDYKTNHKWSKPGTQPVGPQVRATRWDYLPMRRRAGIRLLTLGAVVAIPVGFIISVGGTSQTLRVIVWLLLLTGVWVTVEKSRKYMYKREMLIPTAEVVAHHLKDSRYVLDPKTWLSIPYDVLDGPSLVYLDTSHQLTDTQERGLARAVSRKIGLVHPTSTFQYQGARPYMELRPAPSPPELVSFSTPEVRDLVDNRTPGILFIGLGPRDLPIYLDLIKGAPHVGWSMPTNAGKSTAARGAIMQFLHDGGVCLILDPKMDSHPWARGLPNVRYADTPEEIFDALVWLSGEVDRRNSIGKEHGDIRGNVDEELVGPKLLVIAEELNTMEGDQATYWRSIRKPGDPLKPQSMTALGRSLNMGRSKRVYVFPIAQELLVQSLGGPAAKANLSTRILGRANTPTWNKLAPECKVNGRYPKKSMWLGRVYLVITDEPIAVQIMHTDEQDAIDYALSGTVTPFPAASETAVGAPAVGAEQAFEHSEMDTPGAAVPQRGGEPGDVLTEELVTLAVAAERLKLNIKTLRDARDRSKNFPDPAEKPMRGKPTQYHYIDLELWAMGRANSPGGESL